MKRLWIITFLVGVLSVAQGNAKEPVTAMLNKTIEFTLEDGSKVSANAVRIVDMYGPGDSRSQITLGMNTPYGFEETSKRLHGDAAEMKNGVAVYGSWGAYQRSQQLRTEGRLFVIDYTTKQLLFLDGKTVAIKILK